MAITTKTVYVTEDGTEFKSHDEAEQYEDIKVIWANFEENGYYRSISAEDIVGWFTKNYTLTPK
jgi:hypothetical protein